MLLARHQKADLMFFACYGFPRIKNTSYTAFLDFSFSAAPLVLVVHIKFRLVSFHLHILITCYVAIHFLWILLCKQLITCFDVLLMYVTFLCTWLPFVCLFLFVRLCRPTFSFQFHVIAIATLTCTLLGHHWSMLTGRCNLTGGLWETRKCVQHVSYWVPYYVQTPSLNSFISAVWDCLFLHKLYNRIVNHGSFQAKDSSLQLFHQYLIHCISLLINIILVHATLCIMCVFIFPKLYIPELYI